MANFNIDKKTIRKEILEKLYKQTLEEVRVKSEKIKNKLFSSNLFNKTHTVMFYVSRKEEVQTHRMIEEALEIGKRVVVPYSVVETNSIIASEISDPKKDLEKGPFNIYQPKKNNIRQVSLEEIDLVIVPGVAFDEKNYRLGRGKGYYDRFLKGLSGRGVAIGICFDFQRIIRIPIEPHDVPVSLVITN